MRKYISIIAILLGTGCANDATIKLEGRISVKKSVHSRAPVLVIDDKKTNKDYMIQNPKDFNLIHRQLNIVKLEAKLLEEDKGPGRFAIIRVLKVLKN